MLCPNCGTRMTNESKFCRRCGMNLEPVSRALAAHLSPGGAAAAAAARDAERRALRRPTNGFFAGLAVVVFGMLLIAFLPGNAFKVLGLWAALIGLVAALVSVLTSPRAAGASEPEPAPPHHVPEVPATTGRLIEERPFEPAPPSVTDHTTELLGVEVKDRKGRE